MNVTMTSLSPQVRYRWLVDGAVLSGQTGDSTTLRGVDRRLNNATITCQVTNEVGTGSDAIRLSVLCKLMTSLVHDALATLMSSGRAFC